MKAKSLNIINDHQDDWWINARSEIVLSIIKSKFSTDTAILDLGSGIGLIASDIKSNGYKLIETSDMSQTAINILRQKGLSPHLVKLPDININRRFDLVLLLDVLEHVREDERALRSIKKHLVPGGTALITVPANPILWSKKDEEYMHFRRYTKTSLRNVIESAGLSIEYISYFNFFLFIPALIYSLQNRRSMKIEKRYNSRLNRVFFSIFRLEKYFLKNRLKFPFGVSLIAIVRRPSE